MKLFSFLVKGSRNFFLLLHFSPWKISVDAFHVSSYAIRPFWPIIFFIIIDTSLWAFSLIVYYLLLLLLLLFFFFFSFFFFFFSSSSSSLLLLLLLIIFLIITICLVLLLLFELSVYSQINYVLISLNQSSSTLYSAIHSEIKVIILSILLQHSRSRSRRYHWAKSCLILWAYASGTMCILITTSQHLWWGCWWWRASEGNGSRIVLVIVECSGIILSCYLHLNSFLIVLVVSASWYIEFDDLSTIISCSSCFKSLIFTPGNSHMSSTLWRNVSKVWSMCRACQERSLNRTVVGEIKRWMRREHQVKREIGGYEKARAMPVVQ